MVDKQHSFGTIDPKVAEELGHLISASNRFIDQLGHMFYLIASTAKQDVGYAIWQAMPSDRQARDLLRIALDASDYDERGKTEIKWVLRQAESISRIRNNAAHTFFEYWAPAGGVARLNPTPRSLQKAGMLFNIDHADLFFDAAEAFYALEQHLAQVGPAVHFNQPFPERPVFSTLVEAALSALPLSQQYELVGYSIYS